MKVINIRIPENDTELFGILLRRAREEAKRTQQEMADALGIAQGQLSIYESGGRSPHFETFLRVLRQLSTDNVAETFLMHLLNGHEAYAASIAVPPEVSEHGSEKEAVEVRTEVEAEVEAAGETDAS